MKRVHKTDKRDIIYIYKFLLKQGDTVASTISAWNDFYHHSQALGFNAGKPEYIALLEKYRV